MPYIVLPTTFNCQRALTHILPQGVYSTNVFFTWAPSQVTDRGKPLLLPRTGEIEHPGRTKRPRSSEGHINIKVSGVLIMTFETCLHGLTWTKMEEDDTELTAASFCYGRWNPSENGQCGFERPPSTFKARIHNGTRVGSDVTFPTIVDPALSTIPHEGPRQPQQGLTACIDKQLGCLAHDCETGRESG